MKILVVCQYFYPEQFRVNDVCFELATMGHEVTVLTGLPNYPSGVVGGEYRWGRRRCETINGVRVVRAPLIGRGRGAFRLAINYVTFALSSTIRAAFLERDFDVIFVYQLSPITMAFPALFLRRLTAKPVLLYCQDLWPESVVAGGIARESMVYRLVLGMSRWIYNRADGIAISSRMFDEYFRGIIGYEGDITYLPVYADDALGDVQTNAEDSGTTDVLFAGNIGELQSVETIVMAAHELNERNDIRWHIVGDGSARQRCESLAKGMGLDTVIFHGHHHASDMPAFYSMADALLVTLKANEVLSYTLPFKVQSYMATGKPIIGAINGETRMVIGEAQCGLCCDAEDHVGLAAIVKEFADNRGRYLGCGTNARAYYNVHFRKTDFMERLVRLLTETREGVR